MNRILGIDYGRSKTGVAISDPDNTFAIPRDSIKVHSIEALVSHLASICLSDKIQKIIVGLPKTLKGEETKQTKETRNFINLLKKRVKIDIEEFDERLTTVQSQKIIKGNKKLDEDSISAQIILQNYLDLKNKK